MGSVSGAPQAGLNEYPRWSNPWGQANGWAFRLLAVLDEFTRERLAIVVARRLTADDVLATLARLFVERGVPAHLRSDTGPELCAKVVWGWLHRLGVQTLLPAGCEGARAAPPAGPPEMRALPSVTNQEATALRP